MDVRELITFKTISETRNFSKAAEILGYTQSTVSMQIKNLELEWTQSCLNIKTPSKHY